MSKSIRPSGFAPARRRRRSNWHSENSPATTAKQNAILTHLAFSPDGFSVSDLAKLLGISRQLCLYHVKKMAATSQLLMVLEPCVGNGGLQFRVWDAEAYVNSLRSRLLVAA